MTNEQIEKFLTPDFIAKKPVRISFKSRNTMVGLFVDVADYNDLKAKNFWRVILESNIESWQKTKSMNLARIFNGMEITKLSPYNEKVAQ
jgi:hypothetical protein